MRNFFELDQNQKVTINPDLYSIPVFKRIWDRDKSKGKDKAHKDLSYIFWMCDFRSYVSDITNLDDRHLEVISLLEDKKYVPDKDVKEAVEIYKKDLPISLLFLEDAKAGVNALRGYYRSLDGKGENLDHQSASKLQGNYKTIGDLVDNIDKLEMKVKRDMDTSGSVQGGKIKGMYED